MHNSTYPKVAVQYLNEALCFLSSSALVDSKVLRNRHFLKPRHVNPSNAIRIQENLISQQQKTDIQKLKKLLFSQQS